MRRRQRAGDGGGFWMLRGVGLGLTTVCALACSDAAGGEVTAPLPAGSSAGAIGALPGAGTAAISGQSTRAGNSGAAAGSGGSVSTGTAGNLAAAGSGGQVGIPAAAAAGTTAAAASGAAGSAGAAGTADAAGAAGVSGQGGAGSASAPTVERGPLFPAAGATDVCADATLRLRFDGKPKVAGSGKIRVFDAAAPSSAVATVDLATSAIQETVGGTAYQLARPVYVTDDEVIVRLPPGKLDYGKRYYVTVDDGAIEGPGGAVMRFSSPTDWSFSTAASAPIDRSALRVAVDGTGQFCSVQGALDALPARSASQSVITVGSGTYFELVRASGKGHFTLRGEDRKQTIIVGVNNENLNGGTAKRTLISIDKAEDVIIENLTIHNLTPQGGSQAEALRLQSCERCVVRHADILSLQDTLLWSGKIYAEDCYIAGNVDFVWGTGAVFFDKCEIKTVGRTGYVVQSRNEPGASGYVFVDSKITADPGVDGIVLARIDSAEYPGSHVAYINCQMGSHIAPEGWRVTGGGFGSALRFWEYQSTDAAGKPLDVSRRLAGSRQISADQAATMRDPAQVLGGWQPPH